MRYVMTTAALCMAATAAIGAQDPMAEKQAAERQMVAAKVQNMRVSVETRLTKNAPYSAEAVTESVQSLADGNRIVSKNATRIYRDGEARTRREQLNGAGTDVVNINISDPVTGTTYVLDPATHMAYRNGFIFTAGGPGVPGQPGLSTFISTRTPDGAMTISDQVHERKVAAEEQAVKDMKGAAEMKTRMATTISVAGAGAGNVMFTSGLSMVIPDDPKLTTREELGQQMVEGVMATGTRSITEIPAGTIGNDQPIKVVSEQWYSPELQVLVLTKHSDPRVGETVYKLTNIVRAEPARSLFDLPADYTLKESTIHRQEP